MTYNVFGGTLSLTQSINQTRHVTQRVINSLLICGRKIIQQTNAVVSCLFILIMANATRNANLLLTIFRPLRTGCQFTARIRNLFLVLHKCNAWINFLLLLTQVDFFGTTFYFLESWKFTHYFYFLKSSGMYFYFLESSKVTYFWQYWKPICMCVCVCVWMCCSHAWSDSSPSQPILGSCKRWRASTYTDVCLQLLWFTLMLLSGRH